MSLKKKQRAAARADQAPAIGHVRQAIINVFGRYKLPQSAYEFADHFVRSYATAHSTEGSDPRLRVWVGAWSTHHKQRP